MINDLPKRPDREPPLAPNRELAALVSSARRALPGGPSQRDMAARCGVSPAWWNRLEHGETGHSADFLHRAADELLLSAADREYLLRLAGRTPVDDDSDHIVISDVLARRLDQAPYPIYIGDAGFGIVHANAAFHLWWPWHREYQQAGIAVPNIVLWTVLDPRARHDLVPWDRWATLMVAQLKTAYGRHPDHAGLLNVIDQVRSNPEGERLWRRRGAYQHPDGEQRTLKLAFYDNRPIEIEMHAWHPAIAPHARIISLMPCRDEDEARLSQALAINREV